MKTKLIILSILIGLLSCKKDNKTTVISDKTVQETIINLEQGKHCYQYILENSYKQNGKLEAEKDFININFNINNNNVEGRYIITSKKGEINNGHFVGTINKDIITTIHTYQNTGEVLKDELIFKVLLNKIAILGGQKKLVNGVNMFVDKTKCDYMMELAKISCN